MTRTMGIRILLCWLCVMAIIFMYGMEARKAYDEVRRTCLARGGMLVQIENAESKVCAKVEILK